MGTFTCFGCGKQMDMAGYERHKKECGKFGQRNCVMETPMLAVPKEDPYLKRNDIHAVAENERFKNVWDKWL